MEVQTFKYFHKNGHHARVDVEALYNHLLLVSSLVCFNGYFVSLMFARVDLCVLIVIEIILLVLFNFI